MPDEIKLTAGEDKALDAACDKAGIKALMELGCTRERALEIQAMKPPERDADGKVIRRKPR
jgi:hypothetical protein